ncbi:MAG: hypothetical protein FJY07_01910, partial [Bacteroidetes bacterium]|nr:hypothetical protein [Bacteroidota bacterium]
MQKLFEPHSISSCPDGCIILIYQDSILKYWSENNVLLSYSLLQKDFVCIFGYISNGWYVVKKRSFQNFIIIGLIKIKNKYPYENPYVKNDFQDEFNTSPDITINTKPSEFSIFDRDKNFLFSLDFPPEKKISEHSLIFLSVLYFSGYMFLIFSIFYAYLFLSYLKLKKWLIFFGFVIDLFLIRFIIYYFEIPKIIHQSQLFNPVIFTSSYLNRSLGDLLLNVITLLMISIYFNRNFDFDSYIKKKGAFKKYLFAGISMTITYLFLIALNSLISDLIVNSTISFDLYNITTIDKFSIFGLFCFGLMIGSFVLFTLNALRSISLMLRLNLKNILFFLIIITVLFFIGDFFFRTNLYIVLFLILYIFSFFFFNITNKKYSITSHVLFLILIFSLLSTYIVHLTTNNTEKNSRTILAQKLASERDYAAEYFFDNIVTSSVSDSVLFTIANDYFTIDENNPERLVSYMKQQYFTGFWSKYDIMITVCDSMKVLQIQPADYTIDCFRYFENIAKEEGSETNCKNLFYINANLAADNYLGIIEIPHALSPIRINVEIFSRLVPRGPGYPELLNDQKIRSLTVQPQYSWAKYENNALNFHFGKYSYPLSLIENYPSGTRKLFFDLNHFSHLYFPVGTNGALIISKKNPGFIDLVAPFSYFFLFYGLLFTMTWLIIKRRYLFKIPEISIKQRLQLFIMALTIISFLFVGFISMTYIVSRNNTKNKDALSEKAHF